MIGITSSSGIPNTATAFGITTSRISGVSTMPGMNENTETPDSLPISRAAV